MITGREKLAGINVTRILNERYGKNKVTYFQMNVNNEYESAFTVC